MEIDKIKEFVDIAFDLKTEILAYQTDPILFALYELVSINIYEKYEIEQFDILANIDSDQKEAFFKEKIVEHLYARINQIKR